MSNVFVERLWRSVKYEEVYLKDYNTPREAIQGLEAYFAFYNGQRLQDDRLCAYASFARGLAQVQSLQVGKTLESWQTALVHARRTDDLFLQGWPLYRMPNILIMLGRLDEAETVALEACALTRQSQDWGGYAIVLSALASVAAARGDFDAVERYAYETLLMVSRSRSPWGGFRSLAALAYARTLRGLWTEAEDALDLLVEPGRIFQEAGPVIQAFVRPFRQLLRAYSGIVADVMAAFAEDVVKTVGIDSYSLAPLCALVELGDLLAAPTLAEPPYRVLSLAAEQGVLFSNGWVCLLPRILGIASTLHRPSVGHRRGLLPNGSQCCNSCWRADRTGPHVPRLCAYVGSSASDGRSPASHRIGAAGRSALPQAWHGTLGAASDTASRGAPGSQRPDTLPKFCFSRPSQYAGGRDPTPDRTRPYRPGDR